MEIKDTFIKNGYISQNFLSVPEVTQLRDIILDYYVKVEDTTQSCRQMILPQNFISHPHLMRYILRDQIVDALKEILCPGFALIPDFHAAINSFSFNGWHIDAGDEVKRNLFKKDVKHLVDPEYRQVKCGIFLQDNTAKYAGGIDILPKYHKLPIRTPSTSVNLLIHKLMRSLLVKNCSQQVPTKAGDIIVFDSLLPHKGTHPELSLFDKASLEDRNNHIIPINAFPRENIKIVVYFSACMPKKSKLYLQNSQVRAVENEHLGKQNHQDPFWEHITNIRFPDDFSKDHVDLISKHGIGIVT